MYVLLTSENCTFKVGIQELNLQYIANSLLLTHHLTRGGGKLKGGGFYTLFTDVGKVQIRHHGNSKSLFTFLTLNDSISQILTSYFQLLQK